MVFRNARIFLWTLMQFLRNKTSEALVRRHDYLSSFRRIDLADGVHFLVSISEAEAKLISVGFDVSTSFELSIEDTKAIFRSIAVRRPHLV